MKYFTLVIFMLFSPMITFSAEEGRKNARLLLLKEIKEYYDLIVMDAIVDSNIKEFNFEILKSFNKLYDVSVTKFFITIPDKQNIIHLEDYNQEFEKMRLELFKEVQLRLSKKFKKIKVYDRPNEFPFAKDKINYIGWKDDLCVLNMEGKNTFIIKDNNIHIMFKGFVDINPITKMIDKIEIGDVDLSKEAMMFQDAQTLESMELSKRKDVISALSVNKAKINETICISKELTRWASSINFEECSIQFEKEVGRGKLILANYFLQALAKFVQDHGSHLSIEEEDIVIKHFLNFLQPLGVKDKKMDDEIRGEFKNLIGYLNINRRKNSKMKMVYIQHLDKTVENFWDKGVMVWNPKNAWAIRLIEKDKVNIAYNKMIYKIKALELEAKTKQVNNDKKIAQLYKNHGEEVKMLKGLNGKNKTTVNFVQRVIIADDGQINWPNDYDAISNENEIEVNTLQEYIDTFLNKKR